MNPDYKKTIPPRSRIIVILEILKFYFLTKLKKSRFSKEGRSVVKTKTFDDNYRVTRKLSVICIYVSTNDFVEVPQLVFDL